MKIMNAFKLGLITVALGVVVVSAPLPAGWKLVGGVIVLGLGITSMVKALNRKSAE